MNQHKQKERKACASSGDRIRPTPLSDTSLRERELAVPAVPAVRQPSGPLLGPERKGARWGRVDAWRGRSPHRPDHSPVHQHRAALGASLDNEGHTAVQMTEQVGLRFVQRSYEETP